MHWIYITFEKHSSPGEYLDVLTNATDVGEASARQTLWLKHKTGIVNALRPFLHQGWQPISELDSSCLTIDLVIKSSAKPTADLTLNLISADEYSWWLVGIKVPLRRKWMSTQVQA